MTMDQILKDVESKCNAALVKVAPIAVKDLTEEFKGDIEMFYSDYTPSQYNRGHNLYNGYKQIEEVSNMNMEAGIKVGGEYMSEAGLVKNDPNAYIMDPESVFRRSFEQGIHGRTSIYLANRFAPHGFNAIPTTTPPKVVLDEFMKYEKDKIIKMILAEIK